MVKRNKICIILLIISLLSVYLNADPVVDPTITVCIPMGLFTLSTILGSGIGEGSLMGYQQLNSYNPGILEFDYITAIVGLPAGILFSEEGILFYFLKPCFANPNGDFLPALEIVFELDVQSIFGYLFMSLLLKGKYPIILLKNNEKPVFALTPFLEIGYSLMYEDPSVAGGTGCLIQFYTGIPIAVGGRYRLHYFYNYNALVHGYGIVLSVDLACLIY